MLPGTGTQIAYRDGGIGLTASVRESPLQWRKMVHYNGKIESQVHQSECTCTSGANAPKP
jgi:hypothetical protein